MSGFSKNIPGYLWWDCRGTAILIKKRSASRVSYFCVIVAFHLPFPGLLLLFCIISRAVYEQRLFSIVALILPIFSVSHYLFHLVITDKQES